MRGIPIAALVKFVALAVVVALATTVLALTIANAGAAGEIEYSARFTDATGLIPGDEVRVAGVVVGRVADLSIVDRRFAEVAFTVDRPIPATAGAAIYYKNLIGQRYLALTEGAGPPGATLEPGSTIPDGRTDGPLNLTVLFNGFRPLFTALDPEQVNQLSFEIVQVLQGQGGTVQSLLASTSSLTNTIADRDEVIGQVIGNLNAVLDTVNDRDQQLSDLIVNLQALVSGLAADREPIGQAIASIGELTQVTAGFVGDARPDLAGDIAALGELTDNLNANEATVERFLQNWPGKLNTISRAASYGSWFQFYLCGLTGSVGLGGVVPAFEIPAYTNPAERCGSDPDGDGMLVRAGDTAPRPGADPPPAKDEERAAGPALPPLPLVGG